MDEIITVQARPGMIVTVNGVKVTDSPKRVQVSDHTTRLLQVGDLLRVCPECDSAPCGCAGSDEQ